MNQTWLNVSVAIATKNIRHVPSNLSPTNETKMSRSSWADWYLTPESLQHGCLTTRPFPADLFAQRSYTALRKHPADKWMLPREVQQAVAFTHTGGDGGGDGGEGVFAALPLFPGASSGFVASIFAVTAKQAALV